MNATDTDIPDHTDLEEANREVRDLHARVLELQSKLLEVKSDTWHEAWTAAWAARTEHAEDEARKASVELLLALELQVKAWQERYDELREDDERGKHLIRGFRVGAEQARDTAYLMLPIYLPGMSKGGLQADVHERLRALEEADDA